MREAPNSSEYGKNEFDTRQWTNNVGCVNHTHIHKRGIDHVYLLYHNHPMRLWFWCVFFVISFSLIFAFLNVCVEFCFARIFFSVLFYIHLIGLFCFYTVMISNTHGSWFYFFYIPCLIWFSSIHCLNMCYRFLDWFMIDNSRFCLTQFYSVGNYDSE